MTLTEKLAKFAIETSYYDIPQQVVKYSKDLALSSLGVMVWGSTLPAGKIVSKWLKDMNCAPEAGVFGSGFKTTLAEAALAGGNFCHAAEWEGDSRPEMVGIMTIFPVVYTVGEKMGSSGRDILAAAVIAHEVSSRIGLACLASQERGFFAVPIFGNFGSAIAAARLMKLNLEQTLTAMGLCASQAQGTLRQHDSMAHYVETGLATRNGVVSALMAKMGITADMNILEDTSHGLGFCSALSGKDGFRPEKLTEGLGKEWRFLLLDTKHFPCHSYQQRALEAALHLVNEFNITYGDVDSVTLEMKPSFVSQLDLVNPTDLEHARVSIQHGIAAVLLERKVGVDTFTAEKANDPKFKEARPKVKLVGRPEWEKLKDAEVVTITLKNGQQHSIKWDSWRGFHTTPFNEQELVAKYRDAAGSALAPKQVERSMELVMNLDNQKDVSELMKIACFPSKK